MRCAGAAVLWTVMKNGCSNEQSQSLGSALLDVVRSAHSPAVSFFVLYMLIKTYCIFLYHRYFSPLRHLPNPDLCRVARKHLLSY